MTTAQRDLRIGIIGGSGLGEVLLTEMDPARTTTHDLVTPFGRPSAPVVTGDWRGVPIALLQRHGTGHRLPPSRVPYRANIFALRALGCTHVIASGATGSLREDIHPGELVVCDQLIDRTDGRPRTFFDNAAVHVEFADPFCPVMRDWLLAAVDAGPDVRVHDRGTYLCMEGPSFSTRAESHLYRQWGADVVGMTALPEARLAREAELAYVLVALPTDYDCWRSREPGTSEQSLLEEIIGNLRRATAASIALIRAALSDVSMLRARPSPAHEALRLAIWTRPEAIAPSEIDRLDGLWGHRLRS
ncbi:MAG: S-methyl-5'-thioadenosine phosphorylase [Phycisphaerales bacterium]|nr:S-methyl-5'-thioadenosine phosphorylase [Phycisphaerales bacterium]